MKARRKTVPAWPMVTVLGETVDERGTPDELFLAVRHEDGSGDMVAVRVMDLLTSARIRHAIAPPAWWRARWPKGGYGLALLHHAYGRPALREWQMTATRIGRDR